MRTVKVAVFGDHLRFKPEAEFHPHAVDLFGQVGKGSAKLLRVDKPVAQAAVVVVTFSKPAVVQNQHLDAEFSCLGGDGKEFFPVEVKIGGLPVVDENRTARMLPGPPAHMLPQDAVIVSGKCRKTAGGIAQDDLRRAENLAGSQMKGEKVGVDSHLHPGLFSLVLLGGRRKIPAVNEAEPIAVPRVLVSIRAAENHGGIVLMAGGTPDASDADAGPPDRKALRSAFHGMTACKIDHIKITEGDIHAHGKNLFQIHRGLSPVPYLQCSGDDVGLFKDAVEKLYPHV